MIRPRLSTLLRRLADRIAPAPQPVTRADLEDVQLRIDTLRTLMVGANARLWSRIEGQADANSSQYHHILSTFPRYPDGWTPSPERGERLHLTGWTVERDVDGRRVLLSFNPWRADSDEIRVGVLAWVGSECVSLGSDLCGAPDITHVASIYDLLARRAVDVAQGGGKAC